MPDDLAVMVLKVAELHGRAAEINRRIQRDAQPLTAAQQDLSAALAGLGVSWQRAPAAPTAPVSPIVLRLVEVSRRIGLSRSSVCRMTTDGQLPPPRRLSDRAVGCPRASAQHARLALCGSPRSTFPVDQKTQNTSQSAISDMTCARHTDDLDCASIRCARTRSGGVASSGPE